MVADDSCSSILDQYTCFVEDLSSEGLGHVAMETSYQKKMESTLADENCFKVVMVGLQCVTSTCSVLVDVCSQCAVQSLLFLSDQV